MQHRFTRLCRLVIFGRGLFIIILCSTAVAAQSGLAPEPVPDFVARRFLYEPECEQVGSALNIVDDTTASSGQYLAATSTVFPTDAPGEEAAHYVRLHFSPYPSRYPPEDYLPYFRIREGGTGHTSLWLRANGGTWQLRTFPAEHPTTADAAGWKWVYDDAAVAGLGLNGDTLKSLDIAFTHPDQQLDEVYLEDPGITSRQYLPLPFDARLEGTNCPDFVNIPPVAILDPGEENMTKEPYPSFSTSASDSYDPDGFIVSYDFTSAGFGDYDPAEPYFRFTFDNRQDQEVAVTVYDWYGASGRDTSLWRIFPGDLYTSNRPYYRLGSACAQAGDYWSLSAEPASEYGPSAIGGTAASTESPPDDLPEHQLRYVIRDVPAADFDEYYSRYYLGGVFTLPSPEDNCVWVNINETGWVKWTVIQEYSYFNQFAFDLQEGDNTIRLAYCSPELQVNYLVLSPDTGYPSFFNPDYLYPHRVIDLTCPDASEYWLEAECADYGGQWVLRNAPDASRSGYLVVDGPNAYSSPPADEPANYVRFSVHNAAAGAYYLQARINAPSNLDDSYYVRINEGPWHAWKSGIRQRAGFHWNLFPGGPLTLDAGHNTIDFAYREDGTELDKIYLGPTTDPINGTGAEDPDCELEPLQPIAQWHEAECAPHGAAWTHQPDAEASNGAYLVALDDNSLSTVPPAVPDNLVTFHVDVPATGQGQQLFVYGRIAAAAPDDDSFWVRLNGGEWYAWKTLRHGPGIFKWNRLPFQLPATPSTRHTIEFAYREDGTWLDGIYVTSLDETPDVSSLPSDDTCGSDDVASAAPARLTVAPATQVSLYPNPVLDELTIELDNEYAGRVFGEVFDAAGRRLRDLQYEKEAGTLRVSLPVADLAPGVYRLQLVAGDRRWVKTFLRL
ncbi:T9SS type A sorting domain-containing protein [Neolewinella litorea]|uniref:Secretion system C-terminal sorting domain-containing protein n=1 Tax=Neolewinella litorea TaxID=2562452 RepID=A0A4S4NJ67_9BACT|nr:T9SS type A sorting domain-containing protein [Neolewinella litorea]THH39834.1 hypothetical protein E4021_09485 [Neolewinella litorea]